MYTRGEYNVNNVTYGVLMNHSKIGTEAILINAGTVVSAFKTDVTGKYSYNNVRAKEFVSLISAGVKGCNSKNGTPVPLASGLGAATMHQFIKSKVDYTLTLHRGEVVGAYIQSDTQRIELDYIEESSAVSMFPSNIPYVKLTEVSAKSTKDGENANGEDDEADSVVIRSVSEIMLEKEDTSWLLNKKYYIVNDDKTAEDLFKYIENYKGIVSYDTETTGLNINCFGKIGSKYKETLEIYNREHPEEKIRADRLVGIIFCVEPDVSYYFPCFNRKFKNLYQDLDSPYRKQIIANTKARYRVGDLRIDGDDDMRKYVLTTPDDEWDLSVILMERVRDILTKCHLVAHHGSFEYEVGLQYGIDTNLKDDTMLMHQLMYKFRSTTRNSGEPSNLKYLAKRELGVDQWELTDFFPSFKEDASGTVRKKSHHKGKNKKSSGARIDFSYMDYEGTRVYAPTDGDVTLQLCLKYKKDMAENHPEMEYIYSVEVVVAMAIGYMEFYGHRIDESKINEAKNLTMAKIVMLESELRQLVGYADDNELMEYNSLKQKIESLEKLEKTDKEEYNERINNIPDDCKKLRDAIDSNVEHQINLSAPGQVADLFYNVLGYPMQGDKPSVAKKEIKALLKEKNEDGTPKYPAADIYSRYKSEDTLQTKFFDNLGSFMYPGGFIFSKYGQIAAATGRMSCIEENSYIAMKSGYKQIKEVNPGDDVWCYTEGKRELVLSKVLNRIYKGTKKCLELTFCGDKDERGYTEIKTLKCTPDHRIRLANGKWKQAADLQTGDRVFGLNGAIEVIEYEFRGARSIKEHKVYDLEVEGHHNFIASGICVHNCSKPNAQQYPKVISKIVIPREGYVMIDADYSQIEYRVLTALAKNEYLAQMFADPDSDYHTLMASLMYGVDYAAVTPAMRSSAKSFNFGIPYGMGFKSLAILLTGNSKPESVDEAKEKYELYFKNQPKTRVFFDSVKEMAQVNGYTTTLFKRRRDYSFTDKDGNIDNGRRAAALRQAGNACIQGCESGDTRIQTRENGIVKIEDVVDTVQEVWDGEKWTLADITYSGKKRKCIVTFSTGQKFVCSPIHKFLVKSAKGNERFVECQDLHSKENSKNPHRIVINKQFEHSDYKYSSSEARKKYTSNAPSAKNVFLDDIGDSYKIGVVLGRLASDGNIVDTDMHYCIRQIVAEHEFDVLEVLDDYMKNLGVTYNHVGVREGRTQAIEVVKVHSKSLVKEVVDLDVKHQLHDNIFMDTRLLQGFLRGMFDGDGGITGHVITLSFGNQYDFEPMCKDIQKALMFFGIRSRYHKYDYYGHKLTIQAHDNPKFMQFIGFINGDKQRKGRELQTVRDGHIFGSELVVESVEITDEYIDMYDVCNTEGGYYVADGIITHNTAADIFKIGVARNFIYIRKNKLLGKLLIVNMIHDEQLMEVDVQSLNTERVLADIGKNMQFKVEDFPPLYIGAGVGPAWGYAKDKMAEIHPNLLEEMTQESKNIPIFREDTSTYVDPKTVLKMFSDRVLEFRRNKVKAYLSDSSNWGKEIHPAIGSLINLQFNYGRGESAGKYTGPNGEKYNDQEFLELNIGDFIKENGINAEAGYFKANAISKMEEADKQEKEKDDYDDKGDTEEFDMESDLIETEDDSEYKLVSEKDVLFGASIHDIINTFGCCLLRDKGICGINTKNMNHKQLDKMLDFIGSYGYEEAEGEETGGAGENESRAGGQTGKSYEIVFLTSANVLKYTGVHVRGLTSDELDTAYRKIMNDEAMKSNKSTGDYSGGDIDNRSQAK